MTPRERWKLWNRMFRVNNRLSNLRRTQPQTRQWYGWLQRIYNELGDPDPDLVRSMYATLRGLERAETTHVGDYSIQWGEWRGPGWYYWCTDYPDEGSEGPIISLESARRWAARTNRDGPYTGIHKGPPPSCISIKCEIPT